MMQHDVDILRAEYAALEAENRNLRRKIPAWLAGDAMGAHERPNSPMARVAILTREQQVLMASLRIGEELVALRKSNEVLFRRGHHLQEENVALKRDNTILSARIHPKPVAAAQVQSMAQTVSAVPSSFSKVGQQHTNATPVARAMPSLSQTQPLYSSQPTLTSPTVPEALAHPQPKKKCTPEEKAERRELVAAVLKAGLNQDVHTITAMRPNAIPVPQIHLASSPTASQRPGSRSAGDVVETRSRRERAEFSDAGAKIRESSHSAAVAESRYVRELAIRDMLRGISQTTPRHTPRHTPRY